MIRPAWLMAATTAAFPAMAAEADLLTGAFASDAEICRQLAADSSEPLDGWVLTAERMRPPAEAECEFVEVKANPLAGGGWFASALCRTSVGDYPDVAAIFPDEDGGLNVTLLSDEVVGGAGTVAERARHFVACPGVSPDAINHPR